MSSTFNNLNINTLKINNCPTATSTSKILGYDPVSGNVLAVTEGSVWSGLATSDLDMNGFNIVAPGNGLGISADNAINLTGDSIVLTSTSNSIDINSNVAMTLTAGTNIALIAPTITIPSLSSATKSNVVYYDTASKEISYGSISVPAIIVQDASGSLILTQAMNGSTFILSGGTDSINIATSLSGVASGYYVYVRNNNSALNTTITLFGAGQGQPVIGRTSTYNSIPLILFWNGTNFNFYSLY